MHRKVDHKISLFTRTFLLCITIKSRVYSMLDYILIQLGKLTMNLTRAFQILALCNAKGVAQSSHEAFRVHQNSHGIYMYFSI